MSYYDKRSDELNAIAMGAQSAQLAGYRATLSPLDKALSEQAEEHQKVISRMENELKEAVYDAYRLRRQLFELREEKKSA